MATKHFKGIIALITIKGGAGKTTLAACLGAEFRKQGQEVTMIDADPQQSLAAWYGDSKPLSNITLIANAENTAAAIAQQQPGLVIVDTAGFANKTTIEIAQIADVVLIPCRSSGIDARQALQTVALCNEINKERSNPAKIKVVMTATNRSAIVRHVRNEMIAAGADVLGCEIGQRTSYPEAELSGSAPCLMGKTAQKAADEIQTLSIEILR